ncbi:PAS domain-containing sensor histidine kinase [Sphingobacterium deserti]|uniref:histidine kinase n=1 Tax=Sphingobacterium deserti TaxID=1229276 RepID=A0A0B8SYP6_9SPHI|nr:PAS domain-containing protein [Sphingobacterium deserti]KGE12482.1 PAS/PAC sensor signal transduction histidine kinase [Sphingobacterium deserti]
MPDYAETLSKIYGTALDASVDGVVITDNTLPDNPIIYCNQAFCDITGYAMDEIVGHNCRFLQANDRNQKVRQTLADAIKKGKPCQVEIRNYKKDGSLFWNELSISPVHDSGGNITHFIGIQNDISRRKQAEHNLTLERENLEQRVNERTKELKEHEDFLRGIVETIRESLIVLDAELKIALVNKHFEKYFKVSASELIGKRFVEVLEGSWNIPELTDMLSNVLPTNNPFEDFQVVHDFPYIGEKRLILNASQITVDGNYKDWILLAMEDITERYVSEKKKDDFIAIASHEMKTPITVVKGNLQLLERMLDKGTLEGYKPRLRQSMESMENLNRLIINLLDTSMLAAKSTKNTSQVVPLHQIIDIPLSQVSEVYGNNEFTIYGDMGLMVVGDKDQLSQVVVNLLTNASKYSQEGDPIKVHVGRVGNFAKVSVSDSGIGIAKENHRRIFERFYRVSANDNNYSGAGIGLYICHQIISDHGGTLWVESEMGEGSVFSFTVPLSL